MTKDEELRLALEYVELVPDDRYNADHIDRDALITAIKAALEAKDEPVAWIYKGEKSFDGNKWSDEYELTASKQVAFWKDKDAKPLYTTPPQRTWIGLTDEEISDCMEMSIQKTCRAIEAKLRSKNHEI